jgi:hypothetical protein
MAEENMSPETPPNPCGSLQNPPVLAVQANMAMIPSPLLPLEPQAYVQGAGKGGFPYPPEEGEASTVCTNPPQGWRECSLEDSGDHRRTPAVSNGPSGRAH